MASLNCWHSLPTTCTSYIDERARTYKWQKRNVPRVCATIVSSKTERLYLIFTYKQSLSSYEFSELCYRVFKAALLPYFTNVFLTMPSFQGFKMTPHLSRQSETEESNHDEGKNFWICETKGQLYSVLLESLFSSNFSGWNEKDDQKEPRCLFL